MTSKDESAVRRTFLPVFLLSALGGLPPAAAHQAPLLPLPISRSLPGRR
jgi:hypothetical protein